MNPLDARIASALPIATLPGPLALRFHAAAPRAPLSSLSAGPPYWAYLWLGGAALIAHLAAHPALVQGRRVLDLGAGSGLVGIAAAHLGAAHVTASEIDPAARRAISLNAALNTVVLHLAGDLLAGPAPKADLILIGDLFYQADMAAAVLGLLGRCAGTDILVGDIGRAHLPQARFRRLASYPVRDAGDTRTTPHHAGLVLQFLG